MLSSRTLYISVAVLALTAACGTSGQLTSSEISDSVSMMAQTDVTRASTLDVPVNTVISHQQGFQSALREAVLSSQRFDAAVSRYRVADATIRVSQSQTRPQLAASGMAGAAGEGSLTTAARAEISLSMLVFDGGTARSEINSATARAYAARSGVAVTGNEIARDAALAWIDLWYNTSRLSLLRSRLSEVEPIVERLERLISSGIVDRAALSSARRDVLEIRLEETRLIASVQDAQERFHRYFGSRPQSVPAPARLFTASEMNQMASIWQRAPRLEVAAAELIAAEEDVAAARARFRPRVNLRTSARSPTSSGGNPDATVGIVAEFVFNDGGRRAADVERLERLLQAGQAEFEDAKNAAQVDAQTALARYRSLVQSIGVLEQQIEQLEIERSTLQSQITSGQASIRQLVEAEVAYYQARGRRLEIDSEIRKHEVALGFTTGEFLRNLSINIDAVID